MTNDNKFFLRLFFGVICYCFSITFSFGQVNAKAELDTTTIKIGDQVGIKLSFQYSESKGKIKVTWPVFKDTINKYIEIVNVGKIDTIKDTTSNLSIQQRKLTITSFDSGYYAIPPFTFVYQFEGDTTHHQIQTEPLLLTVKTIPVDTTKEIKDIKAPLEVPFSWEDALPYIIGGVAVILVAILIYWLIKRFRKRPVKEETSAKPARPPHEIALEELDALEKEKLWQQGNYKLYYSRLSDIVRIYIEHRYDINAMEQPTDETLASLKSRIGNPLTKEKLSQLLVLADLVKFAKAQPIAVENEMSIKSAYDFINATKLVKKEEGKEDAQV